MAKATKKRTRKKSEELSGELAEFRKAAVKQFGEGCMFPASRIPDNNRIPFGCFFMDYASFGGVPEGVVTEIFGWAGTGKTTACMRLVGQAQKKYPEKTVVYIDLEGTFDPIWAESLGVKLDDVQILAPTSGEDGVDIIDGLMKVKNVSLIIVDSIPALVPMNEVDASAHDAKVALHARLMGRLCSKMLVNQAKQAQRGHRPTIVAVNQFRSKIVIMGDTRQLPGGNQWSFLCSYRIEILKKEEYKTIDAEEVHLYNKHTARFMKAKQGRSTRLVEFNMITDPESPLGLGAIDDADAIVRLAKAKGLFHGGSPKYVLEGVLDENGEPEYYRTMDACAEFLRNNPLKFLRLKQLLISQSRIKHKKPAIPPDKYFLCRDSEVEPIYKEPIEELEDLDDVFSDDSET